MRVAEVVRTARLDLVVMGAALLDALIAGDRAAAQRLADFAIPDVFPGGAVPLLELRREQLRRDPAAAPWLLRAIVRREDRVMVGFVNFHGRPGVNDVAARGAAELGWTIFPEHRRQGYATEAAAGLMDWATSAHGVRRFVSATTPDNVASLRVHEKLGFSRTGEVVDGELIFDLRR